MNLTILIPCCEEDSLVERSMQENYEILVKYPLIIVDRKGGNKFTQFKQQGNMNIQYFAQDTSFWFARRFGLEFVKTEFVLCLDVDTILPLLYVEKAICMLEKDPKIGAMALYYAPPCSQTHMAFGTSIWRTEELKKLYDWRLTNPPTDINKCECEYMWDKLAKVGLKVETVPMKAIHLKNKA